MHRNIQITKKIFKQKLEHYLIPVQSIIKTKDNSQIIEDCKNFIIKNPKDNILPLLYLHKFSKFLYNTPGTSDHILPDRVQFLHTTFIEEVDKFIVNTLVSDKTNATYGHFMRYGKFRKQILDLIFDIYKTKTQMPIYLFNQISKILFINNYSNEWENYCVEHLKRNPDLLKGRDHILYKLFQDISNKYKVKLETSTTNISTPSDEFTTSQTQTHVKQTLEKLKIKYKEEYDRDHYKYDYYLPELDIIVEYHGPLHFYPLQTQLTEKDKFRLSSISKSFPSKIVIIPYFEWERLETEMHKTNYMMKVLFQKYNIFDSPLFTENYDMQKPLRKYL